MADAPTRRRAPRMDPEKRRRQLVQAAIRAAGFRSLAGVSADDVARESGVSRSAVLKYLPDRDAIVSAVLDEVERGVERQVERVRASTDDPVRLLVNLSVAYGAGLERGFDHAAIILSWSAFIHEPAIGDRLGRIFLDFVELVDGIIRDGIRQRKIPADIDIELAAWTFVSYFSTIASAHHFGKPPEWIYHLQIALLRNLFGDRAIDRALAGSKSGPLVSSRSRN